MRKNGILISWNADKGFGFVQADNSKQHVFAHITAFSNRRRTPKVGEKVSFTEQRQADGKYRAIAVDYASHKINFSLLFTVLVALGYLAAIGYASLLGYLQIELVLVFALISAITYLFYALDKHSALKGSRRTPEDWLHFLSLIGGWPGALIAQQQFRHKTRKTSFRVVFYLSVLINIGAVTYFAFASETIFQMLKKLLGSVKL
ncbi:DUF1294 domain-containing protein [Pseudidiomarina donghaiensis]|uniref:DUF1294 domain-containing protein n=1 Tax=Pseudidiomarina donghaiensis TaxID=519452 RepID=UPI003A972AF9